MVGERLNDCCDRQLLADCTHSCDKLEHENLTLMFAKVVIATLTFIMAFPAVMFAQAHDGGYALDSGHSCVCTFGKRMPGFGQLRSSTFSGSWGVPGRNVERLEESPHLVVLTIDRLPVEALGGWESKLPRHPPPVELLTAHAVS